MKKDVYLDILNSSLQEAKTIFTREEETNFLDKNFDKKQITSILILTNFIESQKSVVVVTITSLVKKIQNPKQDVRLHREEFSGGYSGRSLDTNIVTPWLKEYFPRYAPKESGWLTRSLEQPHPFNKKFPGKIRNKLVRASFLSILEDIEIKKINPNIYLQAILIGLLRKASEDNKTLIKLDPKQNNIIPLTIDIIIHMLIEHFSMSRASRLPVISIYTIYQFLIENIKLYDNKILCPLKSHTTSDKYSGFGDIEVYNVDKTPFEIVEIKHNKPIDVSMIDDVLKKILETPIKRYFILTTSTPNFEDKKTLFSYVRQIKIKKGIDIIPNGVIPSIKYYLRFVPNLNNFLKQYSENLRKEFKEASDIKSSHILGWNKITIKYRKPLSFLCNNSPNQPKR